MSSRESFFPSDSKYVPSIGYLHTDVEIHTTRVSSSPPQSERGVISRICTPHHKHTFEDYGTTNYWVNIHLLIELLVWRSYPLNCNHGSESYPFIFACGSRWDGGQIGPTHCFCRWPLPRTQIWKNIPTICKGSTCRWLARWKTRLYSFRVCIFSGSKLAPI